MNRWGARLAFAAAVAVVVVLQARLWTWCVEDAAISFGYAKHIAAGWGPVPYPGGERVEGYSNPAWVALWVPLLALGADPFQLAPAIGLVGTLWAVRGFARLGGRAAGAGGAAAAALFLACSAPVNIWAQSGLESSLFVAAWVAGVWRLAVDRERALAPFAFLVLALTRPEAPVLAGVGFVASVVAAARYGGPAVLRRARQWIVGCLAPFVVYQVVRFVVFGVEFPATYYAKVRGAVDLLDLDARGWTYFREADAALWIGAWLPLFVVGAAGGRGWRGAMGWLSAIAGGLLWLAPLGEPARVGLVLAAFGIAAALACSRGPVWGAVVVMGAVETAFAVRNPDWMTGFRWLSLSAPAAAALAASVAVDGAPWLRRSRLASGVWAAAVFAAWAWPNLRFAYDYAERPETSPQSVLKRVRHYEQVADTLLLERRVRVVDHDMGAQIYWGAERFDVRDARGLTDLPFALAGAAPAAVDSTLRDAPFGLPDFVHLHGHTRFALVSRPWFREEYVEIPGYPTGTTGFHVGQYVRRATLLGDWEERPDRPYHVEGLSILGWDTRAPEVAPGSGLLFEVAMRRTGPSTALGAWLVARGPGGVTHTWNLPLGYGLLPPEQWRDDEVFVGRYPLPVPEDLPLGPYRLSLVVFDVDGVRANLGGRAETPVVSAEELPLGRGMVLVAPDAMRAMADADRQRALDKAADRSCQTAERAWADARARRIRSRDWYARNAPDVKLALARCWGDRAARRAERLRDHAPELDEGYTSPEAMLWAAAEEVARGRSWDPGEERVRRGQIRVGALAAALGRTYAAKGDLAAALRWSDLAARVDPRLVWERRRAEQLRAELFGLPDRIGGWGGAVHGGRRPPR